MPKYKSSPSWLTQVRIELTSMHSSVGTPALIDFRRRPLLIDATRLTIGDYCDVYLTHDSMSVRKAHNSGRNHLRNVLEYYQRMLDPTRT